MATRRSSGGEYGEYGGGGGGKKSGTRFGCCSFGCGLVLVDAHAADLSGPAALGYRSSSLAAATAASSPREPRARLPVRAPPRRPPPAAPPAPPAPGLQLQLQLQLQLRPCSRAPWCTATT